MMGKKIRVHLQFRHCVAVLISYCHTLLMRLASLVPLGTSLWDRAGSAHSPVAAKDVAVPCSW